MARGARVLLVDDELSVRTAFAEILRLHGMIVETASNGGAGLRAAILRRPDVILLDLRMPGQDGGVVAQRLKADERTATIPLIALTGVTEWLQDHRHVIDLFETVLFKPITASELIQTIEKALGR